MKTEKQRLDNKGAALVTILIGVTFMTIIASSLVYMAYMNYLTKSMRYSSTDNFYTDEFALDELSTSLQQVAADATSMVGARNAVENSVRRSDFTLVEVNDRREGYYDNDKVRALIQVASQEASISVNCAYEDPTQYNLIVDDDYIKLCGVMITATTPEGYQSTITSDVTVYFPHTIPGPMDINDFSIITDSPLNFSRGGFRYYSGNIFAQQTDTSPGAGPALLVGGHTVIGLLSEQVMIVGDVKVTGNSTLHVTGNMIVYGKVTVDSGSALICSGSIRASDGIEGTGTLKGCEAYDGEDIPRHADLPDTGLVRSLFRSVKVWTNGGDEREISLAAHDAMFDNPVEVYRGYAGGSPNSNPLFTDPSVPKSIVIADVRTINIQSSGDGAQYQNALIMVDTTNNSGVKFAVQTGVFANTTILTTGPVLDEIFEQGTSYMSQMTDEAFEEAKNNLYYINNGQTGYVKEDGSFDRIDINNNSNSIQFAYGTVDDIPDGIERVVDGETYYYDPATGLNYVTIGSFIVENSKTILSNIWGAATGEADPKKSMVIYEVWSKD